MEPATQDACESAMDALEAGHSQVALQILAPFPDGSDPAVCQIRAAAYIVKGNLAKAEATCRAGLKVWPNNPSIEKTLARCLPKPATEPVEQRGKLDRIQKAMHHRPYLPLLLMGAIFFTPTGIDRITAEEATGPVFVRDEFTAEQLGIQVDESGRPYETHLVDAWPDSVEQRVVVADWEVEDGRVRSMDGISISITPAGSLTNAPEIDFDVDTVELSALVGHYIGNDGEPFEGTLGLQVRVPGAEVAQWGTTQFGAGTDGGLIGLVTDRAARLDDRSGEFIPWQQIDEMQDFATFDVVDGQGVDAAIFGTGGDGAFPLVRGYDVDGELVAAMLFDNVTPWRLMIDEGSMPADLEALEEQHAECMRGERDVRVVELQNGETTMFCQLDIEALPQ